MSTKTGPELMEARSWLSGSEVWVCAAAVVMRSEFNLHLPSTAATARARRAIIVHLASATAARFVH